MRIAILAIGAWRAGPHKALYDEYAGRLRWPLTLRELEPKRRATGDELRRLEGDLLLSAIPKGAKVVALDETGTHLTSEGFAARLRAWQDASVADVAFLIGGADGHDPAVRRRADLVLSLGTMTWPHLLVRALLVEQIYRAQQIIAGHPYHRA
ncbi:MAG TPA: 23S rRNA (pseudouridine(1915)-N(3))-methyltransferase RlmH [Azospirillaceae bacterium]|nr:23S rRNA (pseudouridine(1915)-N(3))-methyltransferase RlmH [Azospirillaceae bacterium]